MAAADASVCGTVTVYTRFEQAVVSAHASMTVLASMSAPVMTVPAGSSTPGSETSVNLLFPPPVEVEKVPAMEKTLAVCATDTVYIEAEHPLPPLTAQAAMVVPGAMPTPESTVPSGKAVPGMVPLRVSVVPAAENEPAVAKPAVETAVSVETPLAVVAIAPAALVTGKKLPVI